MKRDIVAIGYEAGALRGRPMTVRRYGSGRSRQAADRFVNPHHVLETRYQRLQTVFLHPQPFILLQSPRVVLHHIHTTPHRCNLAKGGIKYTQLLVCIHQGAA